ncbi:glycoside hydrolase family 30 [Gigaspora margarita]|uniref:Glycoside hydrolase family 30 n=1 Tax=Gigaspora margarita TaxID=4874 RepID=A0A8H3XFR6_GIGMA|nr:glycoside hydrolase family 30 [Gigaspora margarita]
MWIRSVIGLRKFLMPASGLGLNVIRYNIGGGDNPSHHHMRFGGDVPGFRSCENCDYNWTSDANQRWILLAAKERGADIFEAFANSPPYWMTNSNCSSGGQNNENNLNPDYYDQFADYLTEVVKWYKEEQGLTFRTLEPFNEPTTGLWHEFGNQEGCNYILDYLAMANVIDKIVAYLNIKGLSNTTSVSIADEGAFEGEIATIAAISTLQLIGDHALSYVSQYNTHAYFGNSRIPLFDMAKNDGRRLWMSEWGSWSSKDMSASIQLSEEILNDMRNLKPVAWVYWQVIEHAPNGTYGNEYGLIGADFSNSTISLDIRLSFYGFAQYTNFIRPGYQIISTDDGDTLAAQDASNKTLVLVCTNKYNASDIWNFNVSKFNLSLFNVYRTSNNNETLKLLPNTWNITDGILTYESPANSITSLIFNVTQ